MLAASAVAAAMIAKPAMTSEIRIVPRMMTSIAPKSDLWPTRKHDRECPDRC
jgi:hypothetical protein